MAITNDFTQAVQDKKIIRIRIMLKDSLLIDPTSLSFDEMEKYALESGINLYDNHDGESLNYNLDSWNENFLNIQMVKVVSNFSKERIELLKMMVKHLYKSRVDTINNEKTVVKEKRPITRKQVGTGVAIGGAALTVAGICASQTALTIGGIVVAAAGVALIITDKES